MANKQQKKILIVEKERITESVKMKKVLLILFSIFFVYNVYDARDYFSFFLFWGFLWIIVASVYNSKMNKDIGRLSDINYKLAEKTTSKKVVK